MELDNNKLLILAKKKYLGTIDVIIDDKTYPMNVDLEQSKIPVTKPTMRGGVYFSDKFAFKIKAKTSDLSIAKSLSKTMLGPSQDFEKIKVIASLSSDTKRLILVTNLVNYVQRGSTLELNLIVIETKSVD